MTKQEKQALVSEVPFWFHSIDFGDGVVSSGVKSPSTLRQEMQWMALPPLEDKTVLDIGAWDGFFSFAAEERGARRVLALDHYVWSMNLPKQQGYWSDCQRKNLVPKPYHLVPGNWQPGQLPGKAGFDVAHRIKNSSVEQLVGDFMTIDPLEVGTFDVVLFAGLLYHIQEPLHGLKRVSLFTRELAVIETAAIYIDGCEEIGLLEFYETNELGGDIGNWFAPNAAGLAKMCRAAGFRSVKVTSPYPPPRGEGRGSEPTRYRLTVHAYK